MIGTHVEPIKPGLQGSLRMQELQLESEARLKDKRKAMAKLHRVCAVGWLARLSGTASVPSMHARALHQFCLCTSKTPAVHRFLRLQTQHPGLGLSMHVQARNELTETQTGIAGEDLAPDAEEALAEVPDSWSLHGSFTVSCLAVIWFWCQPETPSLSRKLASTIFFPVRCLKTHLRAVWCNSLASAALLSGRTQRSVHEAAAAVVMYMTHRSADVPNAAGSRGVCHGMHSAEVFQPAALSTHSHPLRLLVPDWSHLCTLASRARLMHHSARRESDHCLTSL